MLRISSQVISVLRPRLVRIDAADRREFAQRRALALFGNLGVR